MKRKHHYQSPATSIVAIAAAQLLTGSPTATFISNPGVGEPEEGDEIGTESRRSGYDSWND